MIHLCLNQHADLLLPDKVEALKRLLWLDVPARALLIRMVMRKGTLFRTDALRYDEVPYLDSAIEALTLSGLIKTQLKLSLDELYQLSRRSEFMYQS